MEREGNVHQTGVKIEDFDSWGVELGSGIASFAIKDPDLPPGSRNQYCIGFRFLGGDLSNPENWEYDHTNYWDFDSGLSDDKLEPVPKTRKQIEEMLTRHSTSLSDLLTQYCQKLKQTFPTRR